MKNKKNALSTPICAYIWLLTLTILLLIHGFIKECELTKNVGYSLLASFVAAIVIDLGNTRALHDAEIKQHEALTEELRYAIKDLKSTVAEQYYCYDNEENAADTKKTFTQRMDYLLTLEYKEKNKRNEAFQYIGESIARPIDRIKTACEKLDNASFYNASVSVISTEERKLIRRIGNISRNIDSSFRIRNYRLGMKNIPLRLLPVIYKLYPPTKQEFEQEYSYNECSD